MNLSNATLLVKLRVLSFPDQDLRELCDLESRLIHLGFHHGGVVRVMKKAPLFNEPLLVEVRGRLVAMSRAEADLIIVEAME
jgi:Fe2+ transport system protein FeoA